MQKISLNGAWQGVCYCENGNVDFKFDGTVPGCVHTDFINTKIIDYDIFYLPFCFGGAYYGCNKSSFASPFYDR